MARDLKLKGAAMERKAVIAKVKRMRGESKHSPAFILCLGMYQDLIEWLLARDRRYNARKGGLGK